ncbi:MAG: hypothetical protein V1858_02180 [Candidatus Gottesmanbacteria bacterium]
MDAGINTESQISEQLKYFYTFDMESEVMEPEEKKAANELPLLVGDLYDTPGPISEALAGNKIAITQGGALNKDIYRDPMAVHLLQLKLAEDLALNNPERIGLDKQRGESLAGMIGRAINYVEKSGLFDEPGEFEKVDQTANATIKSLREQNALHLTRLEAERKFVQPPKNP